MLQLDSRKLPRGYQMGTHIFLYKSFYFKKFSNKKTRFSQSLFTSRHFENIIAFIICSDFTIFKRGYNCSVSVFDFNFSCIESFIWFNSNFNFVTLYMSCRILRLVSIGYKRGRSILCLTKCRYIVLSNLTLNPRFFRVTTELGTAVENAIRKESVETTLLFKTVFFNLEYSFLFQNVFCSFISYTLAVEPCGG